VEIKVPIRHGYCAVLGRDRHEGCADEVPDLAPAVQNSVLRRPPVHGTRVGASSPDGPGVHWTMLT
jgi:hypothetical protein